MNLNFSFSEASDNSSITIKDTTADWLPSQVADIYAHRADGITHAILGLTILGIKYDDISVINTFSTGVAADLEFEITPDMLKLAGVSQFLITEPIPDGDIVIVYDVVDNHNSQSDTFTDSYFIYGYVEEKVLLKLLETNVQALTCDSSLHKASIRLLHFSYFMSMINSSYTGQIDNLRTALVNLNFMIDNNTF